MLEEVIALAQENHDNSCATGVYYDSCHACQDTTIQKTIHLIHSRNFSVNEIAQFPACMRGDVLMRAANFKELITDAKNAFVTIQGHQHGTLSVRAYHFTKDLYHFASNGAGNFDFYVDTGFKKKLNARDRFWEMANLLVLLDFFDDFILHPTLEKYKKFHEIKELASELGKSDNKRVWNFLKNCISQGII